MGGGFPGRQIREPHRFKFLCFAPIITSVTRSSSATTSHFAKGQKHTHTHTHTHTKKKKKKKKKKKILTGGFPGRQIREPHRLKFLCFAPIITSVTRSSLATTSHFAKGQKHTHTHTHTHK